MKPNKITPKVDKRLFWEYDYDNINWQNESVSIIQRVLERGTHEEWEELATFYGREKVLDTIKHKISYMREDIIAEVCIYYQLKQEELKCCIPHPWRKGYWP